MKIKALFISLSLLICIMATGQKSNQNREIIMEEVRQEEVYQIRIYKLFEWNKKEFYERFQNHAIRIMNNYGFNIIKMWESNYNGVPEFVYLLKWKDEETLKKSWNEFMSDQEWKDIKDQTHAKYGYMVGGIEDRTLHKSPIE